MLGGRAQAGTRLPAQAPAVRGKRRCRLHGGRSTGPRTPEGPECSVRSRWKQGRYSAEREREFRRLTTESRCAVDAWLQSKGVQKATDDDESVAAPPSVGAPDEA